MKKLPLFNNKFALVDDEDFDKASQLAWHAAKNNRGKHIEYAYHTTSRLLGPQKPVSLHRFILGIEDPTVKVDHKNSDGLDCQKHNLRVATKSNNCWNQRVHTSNTTGFKGVSVFSRDNNWKASIKVYGARKHLGYFDDPKEAAKAYDAAALQYFGEFARTNASLGLFP